MNKRGIEYTPSQAALMVGVSRPTITRAIERGELKSRKFIPLYGGTECHAIRESDLITWKEWRKVEGRKPGRPKKFQPITSSKEK